MIDTISSLVAGWLVRKGVVASNDERLFSYAVYSLIFGTTPVLIVVFLGLLLDMLYEGLLLIIPFMLLRKFSGGIHLKSPLACVCTSTCLLTLAFFLIKYILIYEKTCSVSVIVIVSILSLFVFSPIDSKARNLSVTQIKVFRRIARVLSIVVVIVYFALYFAKEFRSSTSFGVGIIIPAFLQLPSVIKKHFIDNKNRR